MPEGMEQQVIKADKRMRLLVMVTWVVAVIVGLVLIQWVLPWGQRVLEGQEPAMALRIIQIVVALIFLSVVPVGVYLACFGWRSAKHGRIPPPGTRVIVDTKVIEGATAVMRGRAVMVIAFLLVALGLLGGVWLPWRLGQVFGETREEPGTESVRRTESPRTGGLSSEDN